MSKSIASYPKAERASVIARRLARWCSGQREQGLGYWAAKDAVKRRNNKSDNDGDTNA